MSGYTPKAQVSFAERMSNVIKMQVGPAISVVNEGAEPGQQGSNPSH